MNQTLYDSGQLVRVKYCRVDGEHEGGAEGFPGWDAVRGSRVVQGQTKHRLVSTSSSWLDHEDRCYVDTWSSASRLKEDFDSGVKHRRGHRSLRHHRSPCWYHPMHPSIYRKDSVEQELHEAHGVDRRGAAPRALRVPRRLFAHMSGR